MKLALHDNSLETNLKLKSHNFKIGNAGKIIGILRGKLYEHKVRTLVQEYISNARDAMREAKSSKRIVITVPNQMNPVFKVRDFFGVTPERMVDVFINYGSSTKEDTNDQAGGFGIGSKSAWAYTDSFTIISITGGYKRTYVAEIGSNKEGMLNELSCEATDEESGTEIHVAVKHGDIQQFRNAIYRAVYFWRADEYPTFKGVVASEVPPRKPSIRIGDLELIRELPEYLELGSNDYHNYISMVIDGIPYKMSTNFISSIGPLTKLLEHIKCDAVIHVGNGVMDIPATRESVSNEQVNVGVLSALAPKAQEGLVAYIKSEFTKAKSYSEWIAKYNELSELLVVDGHAKRGDYSINGEVLNSDTFRQLEMLEVGVGPRRGFKRNKTTSIELKQIPHIFYIDDPTEAMVTQNRRMKEYQAKMGVKECILVSAAEKFEMVAPPIAKVPAGAPVGSGVNVQPVLVKKVTVTLAESEKALKKLLKDLGGRPLSSLSYTKPLRAARATRVKEHEEFTIHRYRYGRKNPYTTTLDKVNVSSDKYLYIDYKDWAKYKHTFSSMNDFVDKQGYWLCAMTPKALKMIKGNKSFMAYETWIASFKPDAKLLGSICAKKAKNTPQMSLLLQASDKIMDPVLATMLDCYKTFIKIDPQDIPAQILKFVSKEVEAFEKDDAELTKLLKASYSLVGMVDRTGPAVANELVAYINSKI